MGEQEALDKFIIEMLDQKQLSNLTEEAKKYLVDDLRTRLIDQINRSLIEAMSDEKVDEFNKMLDDPSATAEQAQQFIANSGVNVKKITGLTMLSFRELFLQTPEERKG